MIFERFQIREIFRSVKRGIIRTMLSVLVLGLAASSSAAQYSRLWGTNGESWSPESRLPDFSYAGYRRGEEPIPDRKIDVSISDFGAKGDGRTDDTAALQKAIDENPGKVIYLPAGRYVITDWVTIRSSGTVLRGAGPTRTLLMFPKTLTDIKPNWGSTTSGKRTSNYSWSNGFLRIDGGIQGDSLAKVTKIARRGGFQLVVDDPSGFHPGEDYLLSMQDNESKTLTKHIYADDTGPISNLKSVRERFVFRLANIDKSSGTLTFDRPLRTDVRPEWKPEIRSAKGKVEESGIEKMSFTFPTTPYKGHFTELGYNAIDLRNACHCWVRDVRIHNSDSGIYVSGYNNTLEEIQLSSSRKVEPSRKATGHHGISLDGQDCLLTRFRFETRFMHGITVTRGSAGNVVSVGMGVDLSLDHHRYGPHSNLYTDLYIGEGTRMFQSGGGSSLGHHSAAYNTFWGIRSKRPIEWPRNFAPDMINLVGVPSRSNPITDAKGRWFEPINPMTIEPRNLHEAQLKRRLSKGAD